MTAPTLETATAARTAQLAVRAQVMRDVARLWPLLDKNRLRDTFPAWLAAMIQLVTGYHAQSSREAGRYYQSARAQALLSPTPAELIRLAPAPAEEWMSKAFGFSGPGMLSKDTARPNTALSTTLGTASRIALDGGRTTILDTVKQDPASVGWYRVTDGRPCAFCALLASRGVVYKQDTVGFKAHNDCGCFGAPAFRNGPPLPDITKDAQRVYRERGKGPALPAFRKAWAEHLASLDA
jgi:hypothetical protein